MVSLQRSAIALPLGFASFLIVLASGYNSLPPACSGVICFIGARAQEAFRLDDLTFAQKRNLYRSLIATKELANYAGYSGQRRLIDIEWASRNFADQAREGALEVEGYKEEGESYSRLAKAAAGAEVVRGAGDLAAELAPQSPLSRVWKQATKMGDAVAKTERGDYVGALVDASSMPGVPPILDAGATLTRAVRNGIERGDSHGAAIDGAKGVSKVIQEVAGEPDLSNTIGLGATVIESAAKAASGTTKFREESERIAEQNQVVSSVIYRQSSQAEAAEARANHSDELYTLVSAGLDPRNEDLIAALGRELGPEAEQLRADGRKAGEQLKSEYVKLVDPGSQQASKSPNLAERSTSPLAKNFKEDGLSDYQIGTTTGHEETRAAGPVKKGSGTEELEDQRSVSDGDGGKKKDTWAELMEAYPELGEAKSNEGTGQSWDSLGDDPGYEYFATDNESVGNDWDHLGDDPGIEYSKSERAVRPRETQIRQPATARNSPAATNRIKTAERDTTTKHRTIEPADDVNDYRSNDNAFVEAMGLLMQAVAQMSTAGFQAQVMSVFAGHLSTCWSMATSPEQRQQCQQMQAYYDQVSGGNEAGCSATPLELAGSLLGPDPCGPTDQGVGVNSHTTAGSAPTTPEYKWQMDPSGAFGLYTGDANWDFLKQ